MCNNKVKQYAPVLLFILFSYFSNAQMIQRARWEGPYDIRMIAAPSLEAVIVADNPDVLIPLERVNCNTVLSHSDMQINNDYANNWNDHKRIPLMMLNCPDGAEGCPYADSLQSVNDVSGNCYAEPEEIDIFTAMAYADYDNDQTTYSSSMAVLESFTACQLEVEAAYLYWFGAYRGSGPNITLDVSAVDSYDGSTKGNDVFTVDANYNQVLLRTPNSNAYEAVTADDILVNNSDRYICVADITETVQGETGGEFWVANIQSHPLYRSGGSCSVGIWLLGIKRPLVPTRSVWLTESVVIHRRTRSWPFGTVSNNSSRHWTKRLTVREFLLILAG